jgi:hypothetical protein
VALISNGVRLAQSNAFYYGGAAATGGLFTAERATWRSAGARKRFAAGQASITGVTNRAAVPEGYLHPVCWDMPQKDGGLASRGRITGTGNVTLANLAGGLAAVASLVGTGDITNAALGLILSAVANLVGSGTLTANIVGKLEAVAALVGAGNITAALGAIAGLLAALQGDGVVTAAVTAKAGMSASIVVTGEVLNTGNVGEAVWNTINESGFSYAEVLRILSAVATGKTTIVDNGGGSATVTFRDLSDTKDRVVAEMDGSERIDVTRDPT